MCLFERKIKIGFFFILHVNDIKYLYKIKNKIFINKIYIIFIITIIKYITPFIFLLIFLFN